MMTVFKRAIEGAVEGRASLAARNVCSSCALVDFPLEGKPAKVTRAIVAERAASFLSERRCGGLAEGNWVQACVVQQEGGKGADKGWERANPEVGGGKVSSPRAAAPCSATGGSARPRFHFLPFTSSLSSLQSNQHIAVAHQQLAFTSPTVTYPTHVQAARSPPRRPNSRQLLAACHSTLQLPLAIDHFCTSL